MVVGADFDDDDGYSSGSAYIFEKDGGSGGGIETKKLTDSDGAAYDYFGTSVAVDGNTLVVGAYGDDDKGPESGSAYIFELSDDSEADGLPDYWEQLIIDANLPAQVDQDGDSDIDIIDVLPSDNWDGDRDDNITEYLNGSDPTLNDTGVLLATPASLNPTVATTTIVL